MDKQMNDIDRYKELYGKKFHSTATDEELKDLEALEKKLSSSPLGNAMLESQLRRPTQIKKPE